MNQVVPSLAVRTGDVERIGMAPLDISATVWAEESSPIPWVLATVLEPLSPHNDTQGDVVGDCSSCGIRHSDMCQFVAKLRSDIFIGVQGQYPRILYKSRNQRKLALGRKILERMLYERDVG